LIFKDVEIRAAEPFWTLYPLSLIQEQTGGSTTKRFNVRKPLTDISEGLFGLFAPL
jgi:hypothetical protein